jgi:hypothetical protein
LSRWVFATAFRLPDPSPRLRFSKIGDRQVKTLKNILFILCVCSLCSKAVMHTYRHFHPAPTAIVGP